MPRIRKIQVPIWGKSRQLFDVASVEFFLVDWQRLTQSEAVRRTIGGILPRTNVHICMLGLFAARPQIEPTTACPSKTIRAQFGRVFSCFFFHVCISDFERLEQRRIVPTTCLNLPHETTLIIRCGLGLLHLRLCSSLWPTLIAFGYNGTCLHAYKFPKFLDSISYIGVWYQK